MSDQPRPDKHWTDWFFQNHFAPGSLLSWGLLGLSLVFAFDIYKDQQVENQVSLRDAWQTADPIPQFCKGLPQFSAELCGSEYRKTPNLDQLVFAILLEAEVITVDDFSTATDFKAGVPRDVQVVKDELDEILARRFSQELGAGSQTGLGMLAELSGHRCNNSSSSTEDPFALAQDRARIAAIMLADIPGGPDDIYTLGRQCGLARQAAADAMLNTPATDDVPIEGLRLSARTCLGATDVIRELAVNSQAVATFQSLKDGFVMGYDTGSAGAQCLGEDQFTSVEPPLTESEYLKVQDHITALSEFLLSQTSATPEVKTALKQMQMWRGPEHIGIIWLSFFVILMLAARLLSLTLIAFTQMLDGKHMMRRVNHFASQLYSNGADALVAQRTLENGRRYQRWAVASIPAIGFIGTVRGILNALPEAREVVFASSKLGRADAIGALAGELGLSFSTTLFALLASLALSFVLLLASRLEGGLLRTLSDGTPQMPLAPPLDRNTSFNRGTNPTPEPDR